MKIFRIVCIMLFLSISALSGEDEQGSLGKIISDIDNYKDRTVTLKLRLRNIDRIFEKIIFYDSDNIDIEFDISGKERRKALAGDMLNLHEGMFYSVTFRVIGTGNLGGLIGEIEKFKPIIIDFIPQESEAAD